jgi:HAD superfamily hydrolase (TIGR01509 family)
MQRHLYECFFLDWDGCLAATLPIWMELCQEALARRRIVVPETTVALELFSDWAGPARLGVQDAQAFTAEIRQGLGERLPEVSLNPETAETLRALRSRGARTAILTASLRRLVEPVLKRTGLRDAVDLVLCLEDVQRCKPDPEVIHRALAHFQAGPGTALMVGDSQIDVRTGHNAGVATALYYPEANRRFYDLAVLRSAGPNRVIADLRELLELAAPRASLASSS